MPNFYPAMPPQVYSHHGDHPGTSFIAKFTGGMSGEAHWVYLSEHNTWDVNVHYFSKHEANQRLAALNGEEYVGSIWDDV